MSYRQHSNTNTECSASPKNCNPSVPSQETLFEFFKQKSRKDLDKSFSSARKTLRKTEAHESPNVKLFKELNSSASPKKHKRLPPTTQSPRTITNPLRMPSPLKVADARLYTSKDESISVDEPKEQEPTLIRGPLFIRLLQNGNRTKSKPNVPIAPKPNRRFSATMPKDNHRLGETENSQLNARLSTNGDSRIADDFNCTQMMNTKSHYMNYKPRTPSPPQRSSRSLGLDNEIKLFEERQRAANGEVDVTGLVQEYEQKYTELNRYMQKQAKQVDRLTEIIHREQEECDMFQLRILIDDLGLTTRTAAKQLKEGLLNVGELLELIDRTEQKHRQEVHELNEALQESRSAARGGKEENQEKLKELLGYIEGLKGKQNLSGAQLRRSYNEELKLRQKEQAESTAAQELETEKMKEDIVQLREVISALELKAKELSRENQCYKEENSELRESQVRLKKEAEMLRKEAEVLKDDLKTALLTQEQDEREEREELRRAAIKSQKERARNKQDSSSNEKGLIKKVEPRPVTDPNAESLKTEVEYLKYKANTIAKDNEELVKRLTDRVLTEREIKMLGAKNQELTDIVKTKNKEIEGMWKVIKEIQNRLGPNNGATIAMICKQNGLEERSQGGKLTHW